MKGMYFGFYVGIEILKDDQMLFFGCLFVLFLYVFNDSVYYEVCDYMIILVVVIGFIQLCQFIISVMGGNRYYFGSGYDYGFLVYGGMFIMV